MRASRYVFSTMHKNLRDWSKELSNPWVLLRWPKNILWRGYSRSFICLAFNPVWICFSVCFVFEREPEIKLGKILLPVLSDTFEYCNLCMWSYWTLPLAVLMLGNEVCLTFSSPFLDDTWKQRNGRENLTVRSLLCNNSHVRGGENSSLEWQLIRGIIMFWYNM